VRLLFCRLRNLMGHTGWLTRGPSGASAQTVTFWAKEPGKPQLVELTNHSVWRRVHYKTWSLDSFIARYKYEPEKGSCVKTHLWIDL